MRFSPQWLFGLTLVAVLALHGISTTPSASAQEEEPAATAPAEETPAAEAPAEEAAPAEGAPENVAEEAEEAVVDPLAKLTNEADILWVCLAAFLVFFMQAGFTLVECGLTRAKNAVNIVMKNVMDFMFGTVLYWMFGFGLMFGVSAFGGLIGSSFFFFDPGSPTQAAQLAEMGKSDGFSWAFLIFQTVFAATAATIVSGAMAERTKFSAYLVYTCLISAFIYPIFGHWAWGNLWAGSSAWLATGAGTGTSFIDYAGSTVVHSIGGWCALAGALVLGPRIGKYSKDGKVLPIPGHSLVLAALGVFILWLGWFGFNPGSTTALAGGTFARIAVITNMSGVAGCLTAMVTSWLLFKKPDLSFTLNGGLAGLVGITAGCYNMTPVMALVTGGCAGIIVVFACVFFDRVKIDDPVGAVSVHGVCGAFGTLAVGLWGVSYGETITAIGVLNGGGTAQLVIQLIGIGTAFAWAFPVSLVMFLLIKYTVGLRVSEKEELEGLDIHEHGMLAYPSHLVTEPVGGHAPSSPSYSTAGDTPFVPRTEGA